jgi:predicted MPP superfamily phosphohydrolase
MCCETSALHASHAEERMRMGNGISWLHLTDLHCGSNGFADSWGSVRSKMWPDLLSLVEKLDGELDLVLFTGDLTQSATAAQFNQLNGFLDELWALFKKAGCSPRLFAVPGNHDLSRPSGVVLQGSPYNELKDSWAKPYHQKAFWAAKPSESRKLVRKAFANYAAWWDGLGDDRKLKSDHAGLLPGDLSATYKKDGITLGLVGLNSAFLQLSDDIEEDDGVLDIRPVQLNAACGPKGAAPWIDAHDVSFLLTHHPATWLVDGGSHFVTDVCEGPDRFALHLFGHMHEQRVAELSIQGGQPRRTIQGAALFSPQPWGSSARPRLVSGYSAGRLTKQGTGYAYSLLPRVRERLGGEFRMVKDNSFEYDSPVHEATRLRRIRTRGAATDTSEDVLAASLADKFTGIAALAGPPRYTDVHDFLKNWLKQYGPRVGPIRVKNIAFDMQHTFPCLQAISEKPWPHPIEWRTVFIDHQQNKFLEELKHDDEITTDMARENERRVLALLRDKAANLAAHQVTIDARAYCDLPPMHGFMVNDSALIVGVCVLHNGRVRSSPYMVFLVNGEDSNLNAEIAKDMCDMFTGWFDAHWASGRPIQPTSTVAPSQPQKVFP